MGKKPTLLIDGDLLLYRAAAACQSETDWGDGQIVMTTNLRAVKGSSLNRIKKLIEELKAKDAIVVLSSPEENFRKKIFPDYKANRKDMKKPMGWAEIMEWVRSPSYPYDVLERPHLEADDCIGIMMTRPGSNVIAVSDDKDFLSIPGRLYRMGFMDREPSKHTSSVDDADTFFAMQCLTGDTVDGFKGCPGIGPKKAEKIIEDHLVGVRPEGVSIIDWIWPTIVATYEKQGSDADNALINARMARILRWDDWDKEKKEVILWEPKKIS